MKWSLGALALCALVVGCSTDSYDANNEFEMKSQCEGFVDQRLKSPSTAEYHLEAAETGAGWKVTGTVDSENGFGAMLRSDVTCVMHLSGDTVYLDDISVSPN